MISDESQRLCLWGAEIRPEGIKAQLCYLGDSMPSRVLVQLPDNDPRWVEVPKHLQGLGFSPKIDAISPIFLKFL